MEVGTRAREVVESYPKTAANYPKVIQALESRFGKKRLLRQVYVRELLKMVIQRATSEEKVEISKMFDRLESHLRALESLEVSVEHTAEFLYPMVESSLPEEILIAWQRRPQYGRNGTKDTPSKTELDFLMDFLRHEVENEEQRALARAGFGVENQTHSKSKKNSKDSVSTAMDLFSGKQESSKSVCIFCEKPHPSKDCRNAVKLSWEEKKKTVREKRACFRCLGVGRRAKLCKTKVLCTVCSSNHWVIMCPELPAHKEKKEVKTADQKARGSTELANHNENTIVLLQTLLVKLVGNGKEKVVRVIFDSGSQNSYILKKTASELNYVSQDNEKVIHCLFGGTKAEKDHHKFKIIVSNLNGSYKCNFDVPDEVKICNQVPRIKNGSITEDLRRRNILITDVGDEIPEIELLIGSDVGAKLLTGKMHNLDCGLVAMETQLGWTLVGKVPGEKCGGELVLMSISLLTHESSSIADLWKLESIGILDPGETQSKKEREEATQEHFKKSVKFNSESRYKVDLRWIEGHSPMPDNKAEKRLISTTRKLKEAGKIEEYGQVFEDWLTEGTIEHVREDEINSKANYLPHRAVFKENSTTKVRPVFDASARMKNYLSLNDCLEKGPNLLEQIPSVLLKFRMGNIGVISDIKKAFLQIAVKKQDCDSLRFMWWKGDGQQQLRILRHRRVVFGVNCSPYLLAAVINHHLEKAPSHLRETATKLGGSLYVDNCVASVNDEEELLRFIQESRRLMSSANFDLRGWEHTILERQERVVESNMVLGLRWDRLEDELFLDLKITEEIEGAVTKRKMR